ncbi:serine hydrolase domain-containing protein [Sphingomonas sp.]|uniref:serine hydrolase domain-containing protein n=2 Tax=unclassified Sphingomonas TaxID=196159 RepID=UPI0035A8DC0B
MRHMVWGVAAAALTAIPSAGMAADKNSPVGRCVAARVAAMPGFSGVVLARRGSDVGHLALGTADGTGRAIAVDTRFNLGSANKMFTAVAVAQLVEAGKVRLDDPIGRYVDGLTREASAVTVRQLLTHSGGLGSFFSPDTLDALARARSIADLLPLVANEKPAFTPGTRFQYSNTGFLLLGAMVERVSGQRYGDYLRDHVFVPADMTATGLDPASPVPAAIGVTTMPALPPLGGPGAPGMVMIRPGDAGAPMPPPGAPGLMIMRPGEGGGPAAPMALPPGPPRPAQESTLPGTPAGSAYSTVGDLRRFFAALAGGKLLSNQTVAMFAAPQIEAPAPPGGPRAHYGFGFGSGSFEGHRWYGHNGGAPGVNVEATIFPDDDVEIEVLTNRDPPIATRLFGDLRRLLLDPVKLAACATGS